MSFRRLPFQFTTTDPVERQRDLERRFGLQPAARNMFVDVSNPLSTDSIPKDSSISSSSPRLQHRVPIFVEGYNQPIRSSVDSKGIAPENKTPNVRVIPIEIEGSESRPASARHRTLSGPAGIANDHKDMYVSHVGEVSSLKHSIADLSKPPMAKAATGPRVHNIPIQVESTNKLKSPKFEKIVKYPKKESPKVNGCTVSKSKTESDVECKKKPEVKEYSIDKEKNVIENYLKKIENVLEEFKTYEAEVQKFQGTTKEKHYRYLDEMLTRCMLKLDDVDTMGNDSIRSARKNAVKKIQASIDLLENKANSVHEVETISDSSNEEKTEEMGNKSTENCSENTCENDVEMTEAVESEVSANKQIFAENILPQEHVTNKCEIETGKSPAEVPCVAPENSTSVCEAVAAERSPVEISEEFSNVCKIQKHLAEVPYEVSENTINICETAIVEKPSVAMTEIKEASSSQNTNSEVNNIYEVEMTDSTKLNINSGTIPIKETATENKNVQIPSNISQDIEMKHIKNTLDNIKENVAKQNALICTPSQHEEECESDMNIEENFDSNTLLGNIPTPFSTKKLICNNGGET